MNEPNSGAKRKIRVDHLTHTTKTIAKVKSIVESFNESQTNLLRSYQDTLQEKMALISTLDGEILEGTKDEDIEKEIDDSSEFKRGLKECLYEIEGVLICTQVSQDNQSSNGAATLNSSLTQSPHLQNQVKLPKLQLKKFDGDPTSWQQFWDSFNCAVHENTALSNIDKFNYLLGLLESTASQAISGLSLSGDNYSEAVKILKDRFVNKQLIISKHMHKLLKLPSISSVRDVKGMRSIYDSIESNVRSLKSLGA